MQYKITCPFSLTSSHEIQSIGFRGGNKLELSTPFKKENPLGFNSTTLEILRLKEDKYNIVVISSVLDTEEKQIKFFEMVSEYFSFLINIEEKNPHYGTIYINIEWFEFTSILLDEVSSAEPSSPIHLSDAVALLSTRPFNLLDKDIAGATYNDLLSFYFDGLKAGHKKSKYFHWFLILEYLENSNKYRNLFNVNKLFDEDEIRLINDVAGKMSNSTKKGAILNLLSRTKEFRDAKLLKMLNHLSINNYNSLGKCIELTEDTIKWIIQGRNSLFHSGSEFPDIALWAHLFPLVTLVVKYVSSNPHALDE